MKMNVHRCNVFSPSLTVESVEYPDLEITGQPLIVPATSHISHNNINNLRHENIGNVLARLETYQLKFNFSLTYITCECGKQLSPDDNLMKQIESNYDSDENDSENDEAGISIDHMLNIISKIQKQAIISASKIKTVLRVVNFYTCREDITVDQVNKIQILLRKSEPECREAVLLFIRQLFTNRENAFLMKQMEIFNDLMTVLSSPHSVRIQTAALKAVDQLIAHSPVADLLCSEVEQTLLPILLSILYSEHPADIKYVSCCILRTLSKHAVTASLVGQELLFIVKELQNCNAKMKEVFMTIVINLYHQTDVIYPDMVDKNILLLTTNMIREGPCGVQQQALNLIRCLAESNSEIISVIKNEELILCILQCLKDSQCKKVRSVAAKVIQILTKLKTISLAKLMMKHIKNLVCSGEHNSKKHVTAQGGPKIVYPIGVKHKADTQKWNAFESFITTVADIICIEAHIKKDDFSGQIFMEDMQSVSDWNVYQLNTLSSLISIATNFCLWPVKKRKSVIQPDFLDTLDDDHLRILYSTLNRQVTVQIWNKIGRQAALILSKFSEKLQTRSSPLSARVLSRSHRLRSPVSPQYQDSISLTPRRTPRHECLSPEECLLIQSLLDLFLCIAISTCGQKKIKSFGCIRKHEKAAMLPKQNLWMLDKQYLTNRINYYSSLDIPYLTDKKKLDLIERETSTEQRFLRKGLFEEDLIHIVSPFISHDNPQIRTLSTKILRCVIQPLQEKLPVSYNEKMRKEQPGVRPGSACSEGERRMVLQQLPTQEAVMIRNSVRVQPSSPLSIHGIQTTSAKNAEKTSLKMKEIHPTIDLTKSIAQQCRHSTIVSCGSHILNGLFSKSRDIRKNSLLLIHDLVLHESVETCMQLSELGCIPKLIDFIRINEDDEMLEIIALILIRLLVSSDHRLRDLFHHHGGSNMLMAMLMYTSGELRKEVNSTLKAVTNGPAPNRKRPSSAPSQRTVQPPDIWDKIMTRWGHEDKVVKILQKCTK